MSSTLFNAIETLAAALMAEAKTASTLRMLADLIEDAKRTGSNDFAVIPVVVDDLLAMLPMIEATLRFNGTRLADPSVVDGVDIGDQHPDAGLLTLIESIAWPSLPGGVSRKLAADWTGGLLQVRFGSAPGPTPTNPGDRASLALYTALLEPGFGSDIGAVAYDETFMDEDAREIAWRTLLDALPAAMSGDPRPAFCRTLLAFVGVAAIDWARHCRAGGEGARYLCMGEQVSRRLPWAASKNEVLRIAEEDGPLVLYLGAGASVSSRLPTGDTLRDQALERMLPAHRGRDFEALGKAFFQQIRAQGRLMNHERDLNEDEFLERLTLERVLREEIKRFAGPGLSPTLADFNTKQLQQLDHPGPTMAILRQALRSRDRLVLLTVNFDQMIEHGARVLRGYEPGDDAAVEPHEAAVRLFVTDAELAQFPDYFGTYMANGGIIPLVKLHGSIELEDVRANVDSTMPGLSPYGVRALEWLVDENAPVSWVYVGCSMRDLDVQMVTNEPRFARGTNERWVAPTTDLHVLQHVASNREAAWAQADRLPIDSRLITWSSDEFFQTLRPHITR